MSKTFWTEDMVIRGQRHMQTKIPTVTAATETDRQTQKRKFRTKD